MKKHKIFLLFFFVFVGITGCLTPKHEYKAMTLSESPKKTYIEEKRIDLPKDSTFQDVLWWQDRLLVFSPQKNAIIIIKETGEMEFFSDERAEAYQPITGCIDDENHLIVVDSVTNSILKYDAEYHLIKKIPFQFNSGFGFHELGSIAVYDDVFYISIKSYQDKYNYIYLISEDGKLQKKIERGSMGFLSKMEDSIWFANSFYTEKEQGENRITSGNSHLLKLSKSGEIQDAFALEDKLSLYKVLKFGNQFYASALGCAGIVELDLEKQEVKVLYELPAEEYLNKEIGQMTIDKNGDFWVIDNFNRQLVKVVKQ